MRIERKRDDVAASPGWSCRRRSTIRRTCAYQQHVSTTSAARVHTSYSTLPVYISANAHQRSYSRKELFCSRFFLHLLLVARQPQALELLWQLLQQQRAGITAGSARSKYPPACGRRRRRRPCRTFNFIFILATSVCGRTVLVYEAFFY